MALSDVKARSAKPREKPYKLFDGDGLFLHVFPNSSKYWRFRYERQGRERVLSLGKYPALSLAEARQEAAKHRLLLDKDQDPAEI